MSSKLFKQFIKKSLAKQGAPGPPPRQGLQWKPSTHRWIRPKDASTGEAESSQLLPSSSERYSGFAGEVEDSTKKEVDEFLPTIIDDTLANDKSFFDNFYSSGQGYGEFSETPSITREGMTLAIAWLEDESNITVSDFDYQEMEGQYTQNDLRNYIEERLVALGSSTVSEDSDPEYDYDFFQSNTEEEGLMGKIPDSLNSYKSDWENRDASARPEWGSDEWNNEVGELTFDIGFAMPEDDADLTRAESDISDAIANSGVEGFEVFHGGGGGASSDSGKSSAGWKSPLHEIAYENIRDEISMSGIPEAEHFNNAKEYADYIDSSVYQSMIDIRNDMEDEEDYFKNNVGFEDTDENIDAYITAITEQAKDYAENVVDQKAYGTGIPVDEMEDEDYDDDGW